MADIADPNLLPQPGLGFAGMLEPRRIARPVEAASEAFGQLTDFYLDLEEQQAAYRRKTLLGRSLALTTERLAEKMMELADDADPATRTDRFTEYGESLVQSIGGEIEDDEVRDLYEIEAADLVTSRRLSVFQDARRQEFANEKNELIDSLRIFRQDAIRAERDGNEFDRERSIALSLRAIDAANFPNDLERGNLQRAHLSQYDTERVLAMVEDGDFGGARELLASSEDLQSLDPDQRLALRTTVDRQEARAENEAKKQNAKAVEDGLFFLERDIRAAAADPATTPEQLEELRARNMDLWRSGLTVGTAISNDASIDKIAGVKRKQQADAMTIETAIENDLSLDAKSWQDRVDDYYEFVWKPDHEDLEPDEFMDATAAMIGAIDVVPEGVSEQLRRYATSDDPLFTAIGAEWFARLRQASPQSNLGLSREQELYLERVKRGVDLNQPPEAILERERGILRMDPQARELRLKQYHAEIEGPGVFGLKWSNSNADWLRSQDAVSEILRVGGWDPHVDEIPIELLAAFNDEVERWILAGATASPPTTIEEARMKALEWLSRVWGATEADGHRRITYKPPEKEYPEFQGDSQIIYNQLLGETMVLNAEGALQLETTTLPPDADLRGRLFLKADDLTARESQPGYAVHLLDENGQYQEQIIRRFPDGSIAPLRFYPSLEATPEYQEAAWREEMLEGDRQALDRYLKGDDAALEEIRSTSMYRRAITKRALQIGLPIFFDTDKALADLDALLKAIDESSKRGTEQAIRENQQLFDDLGGMARSVAIRNQRLREEPPTPKSTIRLREATRAHLKRRPELYREMSERMRRTLREAKPPEVKEPTYMQSWVQEFARERQ